MKSGRESLETVFRSASQNCTPGEIQGTRQLRRARPIGDFNYSDVRVDTGGRCAYQTITNLACTSSKKGPTQVLHWHSEVKDKISFQ